MGLYTGKEITTLIEKKEVELKEMRRDMGGISSKLFLWKTLDDRAKRLEREVARLKVIRGDISRATMTS